MHKIKSYILFKIIACFNFFPYNWKALDTINTGISQAAGCFYAML